MGIFSFFRKSVAVDLKKILWQGAVIIDIRSVHEYDQGRIKASYNIPLERLASQMDRITAFNAPIVVCGNSQAEINKAVNYLKKAGIKEVYNGGHWEKLLQITYEL